MGAEGVRFALARMVENNKENISSPRVYEEERPVFDIEQVDKMNPLLAALAWENFLKRLGAGAREDKAREMLLEELKEFSIKKSKPSDGVAASLWGEPNKRIEELKNYLRGELKASDLRTFEELAGGQKGS